MISDLWYKTALGLERMLVSYQAVASTPMRSGRCRAGLRSKTGVWSKGGPDARMRRGIVVFQLVLPSLPIQFSAVCIMNIDGQTPLELVDRVIADKPVRYFEHTCTAERCESAKKI